MVLFRIITIELGINLRTFPKLQFGEGRDLTKEV